MRVGAGAADPGLRRCCCWAARCTGHALRRLRYDILRAECPAAIRPRPGRRAPAVEAAGSLEPVDSAGIPIYTDPRNNAPPMCNTGNRNADTALPGRAVTDSDTQEAGGC